MTCGVSGVPMSEGEGMIEDIHDGLESDDIIMPSEKKCCSQNAFSQIETLFNWCNPKHDSQEAKTVGGIFAGYAVFWWLTVLQVNDEPAFESIFFGPDFLTSPILAPCLIFLALYFLISVEN